MAQRIVILGSGNVATHLARALDGVVQIYSRNIGNARQLASETGCEATDSLQNLLDADTYIVSVKDDAISDIAANVPERCLGGLWLHTSGSVDKSVFAARMQRYGVLYPLQTFSKSVDIKMEEVPLFIEGSSADVEYEIRQLASTVSPTVYHADSRIRMQMHIAAVFACNFSNYMYTLADEVLNANGLPFSVLRPLLEETLRKACNNAPAQSQTGPAARGDRGILEKHEALLMGEAKEIYETVSNAILKRYNNQ